MIWIITFIAASFVFGFLIVPSATKKLLVFKYEEINKQWCESLTDYSKHLSFTGQKPTFGKGRAERDAADWGMRQIVLVNGGKLSYEKVRALREAGVISPLPQSRDPTRKLPREHEIANAYRICCTIPMRLACGVCLALAAAILAKGGINPVGCLAGIITGAAMESTFISDMKTRLIPWQTTLVFGTAAAIFALSTHGIEGLGVSLATGLAMYLLLSVTNKAMQFVSGSPAIGNGDLRFIPMICIFSGLAGSVWGFMGASLVMALIALITVLFKDGDRKSYLPYAPGLGCWYAIGLVAQVFAL